MMTRQMVICTIDHTDGDLHNDQQNVICLKIKTEHTLNIEIYIWEPLRVKVEIKVRIKIIQYVHIW